MSILSGITNLKLFHCEIGIGLLVKSTRFLSINLTFVWSIRFLKQASEPKLVTRFPVKYKDNVSKYFYPMYRGSLYLGKSKLNTTSSPKANQQTNYI